MNISIDHHIMHTLFEHIYHKPLSPEAEKIYTSFSYELVHAHNMGVAGQNISDAYPWIITK